MALQVFLVGEADAFGTGHIGHVGEDDFVALLEPAEDLDGVYRGATKLHLGPDRFRAIVGDLKEADLTVRAAVHGSSDEENIVQFSDFDVGHDSEWLSGFEGCAIWRRGRQGAIYGNVHSARIVGWRANAADVTLRKRTVLRGDYSIFTGLHVIRDGCRNGYASNEVRGAFAMNESSLAANLEGHGSSLNRVGPNGGNVHAGLISGRSRADSAGNAATNAAVSDPAGNSVSDPRTRPSVRQSSSTSTGTTGPTGLLLETRCW